MMLPLQGFVPERILKQIPKKIANKLKVHAFSQDNYTVVVLMDGDRPTVGVAKMNLLIIIT
jgi:hypothetical protein